MDITIIYMLIRLPYRVSVTLDSSNYMTSDVEFLRAVSRDFVSIKSGHVNMVFFSSTSSDIRSPCIL